MQQTTLSFQAKRLLLVLLIFLVFWGSWLVFAFGLTEPALATDQQAARLSVPTIACNQVSEIPAAECNALQIFYTATGGDSWSNRTNWTNTLTPCSWYGITCAGGHVTQLGLGGNNLIGNLPADLRLLTQLTHLDLHINQVGGSIPKELAELTQLTELRLSNNQLSGPIPKELGLLPKLQWLKLESNQLSGAIPAELGNLTTLVDLILNSNNLTGTIPATLGALPSLEVLFLYDNQLEGSIPSELGNLPYLYSLGLNLNRLTGAIPATLGNFTNLNRLSLANNQLSGSLPPELGKLTTLTRLDLNDSQLSGSLPLTLTNLSSLTTFYFQNTDLCVPQQPAFLSWLEAVATKNSSGKNCPLETPTATPTATATPTPTATPTLTPTVTATPHPSSTDEPNDACDQARTLATDGVAQEYQFQTPADRDWVRFAATATTTYRIEVQIPPDSPADVNLELYTSCTNVPDRTANPTFSPNVRVDFVAPTAGPIYLRLSNVDDTVAGDQVTYRLSVRILENDPPTGALIIVAGRLKLNDPLQANIHNVTNTVYRLFEAHRYTRDHIYYLATDSTLPGYDAAATASNLQAAITNWAVDKVSSNRSLTLYLMDHGAIGELYLDTAQPNNERVTPTELASWLTQLETAVPGVPINVIIEACNAGSFIATTPSLSKSGRVIISSTNVQNLAYASGAGAYFSDHFLTALAQGHNLLNSFWEAQSAVKRLTVFQEPWLDSNGNGIVNEVADAPVAAQRSLAAGSFDVEEWPPYIAATQPPTSTINQRGLIQAEVRDDKQVRRVWAVIYPPSYHLPQGGNELVPEVLDTLVLQPQGNDRYAAQYAGFDEIGLYRIVIQAEDANPLEARPVQLEVRVGSQVFLPVVAREHKSAH